MSSIYTEIDNVLRNIYIILLYLVLSSESSESLSVQSDLLLSKTKFDVELESSSESLKFKIMINEHFSYTHMLFSYGFLNVDKVYRNFKSTSNQLLRKTCYLHYDINELIINKSF